MYASMFAALIAAIAIDPALVPPQGTLVADVQAGGVQIYECRAGVGGAMHWAFVAPAAELFDSTGKQFGFHSAGPAWSATDGSRIVADGAHAVARVDRPGSVPELLLRVVTPSSTSGILSGVTYVQRLDTEGGAAPIDGCDAASLGLRRAVHYSAEYRFLK